MRDRPPISVHGPALKAALTLTKHQLIDMLVEQLAPGNPPATEIVNRLQVLADRVVHRRNDRIPNLVRIFEEAKGERKPRTLRKTAAQMRHEEGLPKGEILRIHQGG